MEFVRLGDLINGPKPKKSMVYFVLRRSQDEYSLMRKDDKGNYVAIVTWKDQVAPLQNIFQAITSVITADARNSLGTDDITVLYVFDDPTMGAFIAIADATHADKGAEK